MESENLDAYITSKHESCKGEWEWSDETKSLQFISSIPGQKPKNSSNKKKSSVSPLTVKPTQKPKLESVITLEDVKGEGAGIAIGLINKRSVDTMSFKATVLFDRWYKTEEMTYLLWCVLLYCNDFLRINDSLATQDASQSFLSPGERDHSQSDREKRLGQGFANICQAYSYFLLHDIKSAEPEADEMRYSSFKERLFSKHTDQMAFEVLYEFVMRVVWVTFGYRDWEVIQKEIGKVFKTSAYNRVIPEEKSETEEQQVHHKTRPQSSSRITSTPFEQRPSISSIRTMRSPAISSLFPTPQEKSSHLLSRKPHGKSRQGKTFLPATISPPSHLGIIGDKLHKYDTKTLKLLHGEKKKLAKKPTGVTDEDKTLPDLQGSQDAPGKDVTDEKDHSSTTIRTDADSVSISPSE